MVIPFGPQHPSLVEPIHMQLEVEGDTVLGVRPAFGFVHRGLEKLAEKRDWRQNVYLVERTCGICSFIHSLGYCLALEDLLGVEVPPRADLLRVMWGELHRIQSHYLWLGLLADAVGFESLFMQTWRNRERVLDLNELTAGNRIVVSMCRVGGTARDLDAEMLDRVEATLDAAESEFGPVEHTFREDGGIARRLVGLGRITREEALGLGAVGPVLRATGEASDSRLLGYAGYGRLQVAPVTQAGGDAYARLLVRLGEIRQSMALLRQVLPLLRQEPGETLVPVRKDPTAGEALSRVEQPRGELIYYVRATGGKLLDRVRIRTPTFANLPALVHMVPGNEIGQVPALVLSIDPCVSCTER